MIIPNKFNGYSRDGRREYHLGGGGGGPTNSTVTQSNIPDWLRPQVEQLLGGATQQLFTTQKGAALKNADGTPVLDANGNQAYAQDITGTKPYTPYSTNPADYVAGFSPLQQQVQNNAANLQMPGQFQQGTDLANAAGMGGMQSAQQALGYGNAGFQSGQQGQQLGIQGGQYYGNMGAGYGQQAANLAGNAQGYGDLSSQIGMMGLNAQNTGNQITNQSQNYAAQQAAAGQNYANQATNAAAIQQYMNPYLQSVTDLQNQAAQRQADIAAQSRGSAAARAGAFGGARQAIEDAEANRALQSTMNMNQATGLQNAYAQAMQNMQYGNTLGLQGLSGAQSGLGTALQGGQLGLSGIGAALQGQQGALSGVNAANQAYQTGIQGAGMGLQGVDRQLAGTAQGMQGAQVGLQGVSGAQAGYGLANQAANTLGSLGTQQNQTQMGILGLQNTIGGQQQAQQQNIINNAINNYAQAQQQPLTNLNNFNALLRGYAVPGQTTTQYSAQPTLANQITGMGIAGVGLANAMGKS
jgi:hypothetical protein